MTTRRKPRNSFYSYSSRRTLRQEELQAYRRIMLATLLVVGLIVGGYFLGVPLLANMGGSDDSSIDKLGSTDSIAPAPPKINGLPDYINSGRISISGTAESGSTVEVFVNDEKELSALVDKEGLFTGEITLTSGENVISATAKDAAGNISKVSKSSKVIYDATPPSLVLLNEIPSTSDSSSISLSAKTEPGAKASVNDRRAVVRQDGSFSLTIPLKPGKNVLTILAEDAAGNTRKLERTIERTTGNEASGSAETE